MSAAGGYDPVELEDLPEPVRRYLGHALAPGVPLARRVRLEMTGRIRVGAWLGFEAEWEGDGRSFSWRASAGPWRLRPLLVHDQFSDGTGSMEVRLRRGPRLLRADGEDVARSGAGRAALEAIWSPASLLPRCGVEWRAEPDGTIVATRSVPPERVELSVVIDDDGAVRSCSGMRWRDAKHGYEPFGAEVTAERSFGGLTIPNRLDVGWGFGTDKWSPFFSCEVTAASATHHP